MKLSHTKLKLENELKIPQEMQINPSLYKKISRTKHLLKKKENPKNFEDRGGIALNAFNYFNKKWEVKNRKLKEHKASINEQTSSLKSELISEGSFKEVKQRKNALVLLIEFKDKKHTVEPDYFKDFLFKESNASMRDYFLEASYGKLEIDGDISNWYTAKNERIEYVDKELVNGHYPKARELIKEVIFEANNDANFNNFSKYSKDGKIEILIVIYAGKGLDSKIMDKEPKIEYIWPHFDKLEEPIQLQEGIEIDSYCIIPELPKEDLGCICHEVSHALGLPDLYYESRGPIIGSWCLMAAGGYNNNSRTPALPSAWCRMYMGWAEPEITAGEPKEYEIPAIIESNKIYKLDVEGSNGKEYFLVENRQQQGFDEYLPSSGLLIWHVDESAFNKYYPNSNPQHFFLTLEQSDGKRELEDDWTDFQSKYEISGPTDENKITMKNVLGDEGDAYPGEMNKRTFNDESEPNSNSYSGKPSRVIIESISDSKGVMSAIMGIQSVSETKIDMKYYREGYKSGYKEGYNQFMKEIMHI